MTDEMKLRKRANVNHDLTDQIHLITIKNNNNVLFETSNLLFLVVTFHILSGCHY